MPKKRVSALPNSYLSPQLQGISGSKLDRPANKRLLPKQRVGSPNLLTRSSFKNRDSPGQNPPCTGPGTESPYIQNTDSLPLNHGVATDWKE
jgi:hypothetical protein